MTHRKPCSSLATQEQMAGSVRKNPQHPKYWLHNKITLCVGQAWQVAARYLRSNSCGWPNEASANVMPRTAKLLLDDVIMVTTSRSSKNCCLVGCLALTLILSGCGGGGGGGGGSGTTSSATDALFLDGSTSDNIFVDSPGVAVGTGPSGGPLAHAPEPATLGLFASAVVSWLGVSWRRTSRKQRHPRK